MYSPNLLITNFCNQDCEFCFASREMSRKALKKEMKIGDFKKIVAKLSRGHTAQKVIKLLGGEPTLHSKLFEMLDVAVKKSLSVQIFTNGIMGNDRIQKLAAFGEKIGYTINVSTPGFQHNMAIQNIVRANILTLRKKSKVTLSITIDPYFHQNNFISSVSSTLPFVSDLRIGLANPIARIKNWYSFADFSKIGGILERLIKTARKNGYMGTFTPNCGFTRCMFSDSEYAFVKKRFSPIGWGCFGKASSMDIAVDLSTFHCFSLADNRRVDLAQNSYNETNKKLIKERMVLWSKLKKSVCANCLFYGFSGDKCPGPCIAFAMNEQ